MKKKSPVDEALEEIKIFIRISYGSDRAFDLPLTHVLSIGALSDLYPVIKVQTGIEMSFDKELTLGQYALEFYTKREKLKTEGQQSEISKRNK